MNLSAYQSHLQGLKISAFRLQNAEGMHCLISNYGARILQIHTPDKHGQLADIVLGHDRIEEYVATPHTFFGACVGRVANRTAGAHFTMAGIAYPLTANEGQHHLHGGPKGFHHQVWEVLEHSTQHLLLHLHSPDGEEGYPGHVDVSLSYTLRDDNTLEINYQAHSDTPTPLNLTNHSYFNLDGCNAGRIVQHELTIHAERYCPIAPDFLPTGKLTPVTDSPFDFQTPAILGERFYIAHEQLQLARGFDHHYVVDGQGMRAFAKIRSPQSGRSLMVRSDAPGMQFYSGNFLDGSVKGKAGMACKFRSAFCFETQGFPNSLNTPSFPSILIGPDKPYRSTTVFEFGMDEVG